MSLTAKLIELGRDTGRIRPGERLTVREIAARLKDQFPELGLDPAHPDRDHFKTLRNVLSDFTHEGPDGRPAPRADRSAKRPRPHGEGLWVRHDRHEGKGRERRCGVALEVGTDRLYDTTPGGRGHADVPAQGSPDPDGRRAGRAEPPGGSSSRTHCRRRRTSERSRSSKGRQGRREAS